jgi:hypothetical protein
MKGMMRLISLNMIISSPIHFPTLNRQRLKASPCLWEAGETEKLPIN